MSSNVENRHPIDGLSSKTTVGQRVGFVVALEQGFMPGSSLTDHSTKVACFIDTQKGRRKVHICANACFRQFDSQRRRPKMQATVVHSSDPPQYDFVSKICAKRRCLLNRSEQSIIGDPDWHAPYRG